MSNLDNNKLRETFFWLSLVLLITVKLVLISGEAVQMIYAPHDDGLYVSRAFHLLLDGSFGPYDSRLLIKLPGISLWLAGARLLGVPYLLSINILYVLAGIYLILALRRCGFNRALLVGVFALYLFNPVTLDPQWFRVMREPLAIGLLVVMLASIIHVLADVRDQRFPLLHIISFSAAFAFALLVREEDRVLYGLFAMFVAVLLWQIHGSWGYSTARARMAAALAVGLPLTFALGGSWMALSFVERHYGAPVLYDFGDGEFPKLIAAMRSVESKKDNRHVMITQEALGKLRTAAPSLAPVIDRLPPPSPNSYSCERFRVCSEWTNGWELFWIKDAAFQAGLTPTHLAAQAYFHRARIEIERACADGRLVCRDKGHGLLPPMELRWTRAYLQEGAGILRMMYTPGFGVTEQPPLTYPVGVDYGRMYQTVTMSHHYDTQLQGQSEDQTWKTYPKDLHLGLKYWLRYPDIASAKDFGPNAGGDQLGAITHYQRHGQAEGRIWEESEKSGADQQFVSPWRGWKTAVRDLYQKYGTLLELLGGVALILRLLMWRAVPLGPVVWVALMFTGFTVLRLLALSYVSVYMGGLDGRLFFSTYVIALLLAPLVIADALRVILDRRRAAVKSIFGLGR